MVNLFSVPVLTRSRIYAAFAVGLATDTLQVLAGPLGWLYLDQALDALAMVLTTALIGFHPLLLPTFLVELIPVVDWLPTWTGSVAVVVALRKKQSEVGPAPSMAGSSRVIDV